MAEGTITIYGEQECDFIWVVKGTPSSDLITSLANLSYEPVWDNLTLFQAFFNETFVANGLGGSSANPDYWRVYRYRDDPSSLDFVVEVDGNTMSVKDYMCKNKKTYTYQISAINDDFIEIPITSGSITPKWDGWSLITVSESSQDDVLIADDIFGFSLNVTPSQMSNNSQPNVLKNFTRYPKVQPDTSNYLSGILTGLIGSIDCETGEYIEAEGLSDAIMDLSTDGKRKFLKDLYGNILEVSISEPIARQEESYTQTQTYSDSIGWVQIGSSDGISIVGDWEA